MKKQKIGRGILIFSIITTVLIVAAADVFNRTHLFNPLWPPHARFHIGMQFTALVLVSIFSFRGWKHGDYVTAALAPLSFWPGLFVAWLIPGTSAYATPEMEASGIAINLWLAGIWITLTAIGLKMASLKE